MKRPHLGTLGLAGLVIACMLLGPSLTAQGDDFVRGDFDGSSSVNIGDALALLDHLVNGAPYDCTDAGDLDDNGVISIGDPVYLLYAFFQPSGPPFLPPTSCGDDPTPDTLDCASYPLCP